MTALAAVVATVLVASGALASGLLPGSDTPPQLVLPDWQSSYDWEAGDGYAGWTPVARDGYGLEAGHGGRPGLWIWPRGGRTYGPGGAGWTLRAPGTTRIASARITFTYPPKVFAHHCLRFALTTGAQRRSDWETCKPPATDVEQGHAELRIADPSGAPSAKELSVELAVPECTHPNAKSCEKWIPEKDPLGDGGFVRIDAVDLVLVDDDAPTVVPSKAFFELDGTYIDGRQSYALRVDAGDAGGGITRVDVDHTGWPGPQPSLVDHTVTCDPEHHTAALGARNCPAGDRVDVDVDTRPMPEGTRRFRASSPDVAGNVGDRRWTVIIDRTAPEAPRDLRFSAPEEGSAEAVWNATADPVLPDGTAGSGVAGYRVRHRVAGGGWSDWRSYDRDARTSEDVFDQPAGTSVEFEAVAVDAVGNVSDVARTSGAAWGTAPTVTLGGSPDEEYFGSSPLTLTANARDGETGVRRVRLTADGAPAGEWAAPCTPRTRSDGRAWKASCPETFAATHVVNTAGLSEGPHRFTAHAVDRASNEAASAPVDILVDHTAPGAPSELRLDWFNPDTKRAQVSWMPGDDPDLSEEVPGAGADTTLVSYLRENGHWSDWLTTTDDELEVAGSYVGESIGLRVRTIDEVGNTGPMSERTMTVTQLTEEPDVDEGDEDDGTLVVGVQLLTKTGAVLSALPEAEVTVRSEDGTVHTGLTDVQGRTTFGDVEPGTYAILPVSYGGLDWSSATRSVTVPDEGAVTATVSLATGGSGPSRAQAAWCAKLDFPRPNSAFCRRFWGDRAVAERYAERVFSGDPADGSRANAFQHAYWTALMANSILSTSLLPDGDLHKAREFADINEDEVLEADDGVSVDDRRHARMDKHNNHVGYDYIVAVSKRENHNDRYYCNMLRKKAARAKKTRFSGNSSLPGFVAGDRLMFWKWNVKVLPYDHNFGDGNRPCGES